MMEVRIFKTGRVRRGELLRADSRSAIAGEHTTSEERSAQAPSASIPMFRGPKARRRSARGSTL
jgi:hypothetical protein